MKESTVNKIFKSKAKSKIYVFLLNKKSAKTEEIIKGTKLHPSTVREALVEMHKQKSIFREKIKTNGIGRKLYVYYPKPFDILAKQYINEFEQKVNKINTKSTGYFEHQLWCGKGLI